MKIAGLVKSSLIDYPNNIAAVVFTQGCNFRCGFCHNPDLLEINKEQNLIPQKEVLDYLKSKKNLLDGVVITGGEPTLQQDLVDFIKKLKELEYAVKIDTNGSNPKLIKELIDNRLVDYIAMDIKGPLEKYSEICAYVNKKVIQESINLIMSSGVEYEFRTTVLPAFHTKKDLIEVGKMISGAKRYTIQGFRPDITYDKKLNQAERFLPGELNDFAKLIKTHVDKVIVHDNY